MRDQAIFKKTAGAGHKHYILAVAVAFFLCSVSVWSADIKPVQSRLVDNRHLLFLAPDATALAISDVQRKLAVGFSQSPAKVWLLKLDAKGNLVSEPPAILDLPGMAEADNRTGHPVSLVFHPKSPVLYVWRHFPEPGEKATVPNAFDHLVIFDLSNEKKITVAAAVGRGNQFSPSALPAHMTMDPEGRRLFVPNLQIWPERGAMRPAVGYFPLDQAGLPLISEDQAQLTVVDVSDFQPMPTGRGFLADNERILLMAGQDGIMVWDTLDRRAAVSRVLLPGLPVRSGFLGGDADRVYWVGAGSGILFSMRHAEGYPTLLPESHVVEKAVFCSPPIRMFGKQSGLAIGGNAQIHWIGLNPDGGFSGKDASVSIPDMKQISILAYSKGFDRLYVPVEKEP